MFVFLMMFAVIEDDDEVVVIKRSSGNETLLCVSYVKNCRYVSNIAQILSPHDSEYVWRMFSDVTQ